MVNVFKLEDVVENHNVKKTGQSARNGREQEAEKKKNQKLNTGTLRSITNQLQSRDVEQKANNDFEQAIKKSNRNLEKLAEKRNGSTDQEKQVRQLSENLGISVETAEILYALTSLKSNQDTDTDKEAEVLNPKVRQLSENLGTSVETATILHNENMLTPLPYGQEYKIIGTYFSNSQVENHLVKYGVELTLSNIYKVTTYTPFEEYERHLLLWHGTKEDALVNVIRNGLTKKSQHGQQEGRSSMFGDGIYFADRVTKSMQYVETTEGKGFEEGCHHVLLCQVALGKMYDKMESDHSLRKAPGGCDSVRGVGRYRPFMNGNLCLGYITVPAGITKLNPCAKHSKLAYNEYVIYNENRARIRYIVSYRVTSYDNPNPGYISENEMLLRE